MYEELSSLSVLYVEDDEGTREHLHFYLSASFKSVFIAKDGAQGLALFKADPMIDLVISDIHMPHSSGLEMVRAIKAIKPDVPVVLTTAYDDQKYLLEAIELGVFAYVCKPVDIDLLFQKLLLISRKNQHTQKVQWLAKKMSTLHTLNMDSFVKALDTALEEFSNRAITPLSGGYAYDWEQKIITHDAYSITLTHQEIIVLELLLSHKNKLVSYEQLIYALSQEHPSIDTLRTLVRSIRHKTHKELITNLSGLGYKIHSHV